MSIFGCGTMRPRSRNKKNVVSFRERDLVLLLSKIAHYNIIKRLGTFCFTSLSQHIICNTTCQGAGSYAYKFLCKAPKLIIIY